MAGWVYRRPFDHALRARQRRRVPALVASRTANASAPASATITTQTVVNESGLLASNQALQWGVPLKRGAINLATHTLFVTDASDNEVAAQFDDVSTWDDGTVRHAVCSMFVSSIGASATAQFKFKKKLGAHPTGVAARTTADITAHDYKIVLRDVRGASDAVYNGGEFTFAVNDYIATAARVRKYATGAHRDSWRIDGEFKRTSDSVKDAHLWGIIWLDVWTRAGAVHAITINAAVCLPWRNVTGAQGLSFYADLKDGAATIRSFDDAAWQTIDAATELSTSGGNTVTKTAHGVGTRHAGRMTTTGTMPAPLTAGQTVYPTFVSSSTYRLQNEGAATITLTDVGSGTHSIRRCLYLPYRTAMLLSDADAKPDWSANEPTLRMQLSAAEKQYWIESGVLPPYDVAITPNAQADTNYYPGTVTNLVRSQLNQTGGTDGIGIQPAWIARAFLRQDSVGLKAARIAPVQLAANLHMMCLLDETLNGAEKYGTIIAANNGPDSAGASYAGMGPPNPNDHFFGAGNRSGFVLQTGAIGAFRDISGSYTGNDRLADQDGSHWPSIALYPYLVEGGRHQLEMLWWSANRHQMSFPGSGRQKTVGATTWYGVASERSVGGNQMRTDAWTRREVALAAAFGADGLPEKAYFKDCIDHTHAYLNAIYATRGAAFNEVGYCNILSAGGGGQASGVWGISFQAMVNAWSYALLRSSDALFLTTHTAKWGRGVWTGMLCSPGGYDATYYDCDPDRGMVRYAPGGRAGNEWAHFSEQGALLTATCQSDGQTFKITNKGFVSRIDLTAGDRLRFTNANEDGIGRSLPPEEPTGTVNYHLVSVDTTARTCKLALTAGGSPQTFTPGTYAGALRLQTGRATGSLNSRTASDDWYPTIHRGGVMFSKFVGIADMDAAAANADERVTASFLGTPMWALGPSLRLQDQSVPVGGGGNTADAAIFHHYYAMRRAA